MGYIIVTGGQFGSEGKGKVASHFAETYKASAVCRIGGPNSGHTIWVKGKECKLRMLPTAALTTNCLIIFPAGAYINLNVLIEEIVRYDIDWSRIRFDYNTMCISDRDIVVEMSSNLRAKIASTNSGTGATVIRRIERKHTNSMFSDLSAYSDFVCDTKELLSQMCRNGETVIIEGTQGYGLSVLHTPYYPYCTARDTSAAGILSEVGGSIRDVDKIVTVFRTYPIRVGGNSGPLRFETDWETVTKEAGSSSLISEYTTVTHTLRRVAKLDISFMRSVIESERPDIIVLNHMDYIDSSNKGNTYLSEKQEKFIADLELQLGTNIDLFGNGEDVLF